ncbi:MAG TPA: antibiotic biosynthesis monooxygenase family protein [Cyclobacteriaceae bacterium]|jgi:quinol monooxygenase YgiN
MKESKSHSVEIIRYSIPQDQRTKFEEAYRSARPHLEASPYCLGYEVIHGVDEPGKYIVRIHWTSVDDHLNGFRRSEEFSSFFILVKPYYNFIEEMKHYETVVSTLL